MSLSKIVAHLSALGSTSDDPSYIALLDEEFMEQLHIALIGYPVVFIETREGQNKDDLHTMINASMDKYISMRSMPKYMRDDIAITSLGSYTSEIISKKEGEKSVEGRLVKHLNEKMKAKEEPAAIVIDGMRGFSKDESTAEAQLITIAALAQFMQGKSVTIAHVATPARADMGKTGLEVDSPMTADDIKRLIVILPPPQADLMPRPRTCDDWKTALTGTKASSGARSGVSKMFADLFNTADQQAVIIRTLH